MSRTHRPRSTLIGNYVTLYMTNKAVVTDETLTVDRIPFSLPFRIVRASFAQFGGSGDTQLRLITHDTPKNSATATALVTSAILTDKVAVTVSPGNLVQPASGIDPRNIPPYGHVQLAVVNDGGALPAGGGGAWITGYFTRHISDRGNLMEQGQMNVGGPAVGYYDNIHLANLDPLAGVDADAVRCEMIVPYNCRVMAIQYNGIGFTEVGDITFRTRKNTTTNLHADLNMGADPHSVLVDANSGTAFASSAARDLSRGNTLELWAASDNAGDVVPIQSLTADVLVWVKGHARDENAEPTIED